MPRGLGVAAQIARRRRPLWLVLPWLWAVVLIRGSENEYIGHGTFVWGILHCVFEDGGGGFGIRTAKILVFGLVERFRGVGEGSSYL